MDKSISEALYRTVSIIATAAPLPADRAEASKQIFVSILRILGALLIASFTALFTNYLLRARLSGAFDVRRIPDSGHVIVCGLGNLGFRVVEELLGYGERVVVIERQRDARFMAAMRRRAVATVVGDATLIEVLRLAHSSQAKAVVAATSDQLANLEIALMAREINPQARVIVRLLDSVLAETLRDAANIRYALSIPRLAAPAFVAALFGDRVQSVFQIKGRLFAAVELVIQIEDAFLIGQGVRALAIDYGLLPVRLAAADGSVRSRPLHQKLCEGDRLTAIISLQSLESLWRRDRPCLDHCVEVMGFILPARPLILQMASAELGLAVDVAEQLIDHPPFTLRNDLTRGQAEEFAHALRHEGVKARVRETRISAEKPQAQA
jgi:Trk K+ transport system NAD-binding subunit